jgi:hypothetical protein
MTRKTTKKTVKRGRGGPPEDLRQAMLRAGYMHREDVIKLVQRSRNWFDGKNIRSKGDWFVFLCMEDVARALGPELAEMRGLNAANGWGTKAA